MKVIICGAGQVGWQIARHLCSERNDVTVVDNNPALVRNITDTLDVTGIAGFASHPDVLERAGARDADMVIAATFSDEVNMVTCQVAHSVFSVPRKVARLRAQSYLDAIYSDLYRRDHLPIDVVISPEQEVAAAAMKRLSAPSAFDTELFMDGKLQLLGLRLTSECPVLNTPLRQLSELFSTLKAVVVGIRRGGNLFVPDSSDQLMDGDEVYVFSSVEDVPRTLEIMGREKEASGRVLIVGGGNVGLRVARSLEANMRRIRARVIEKDRTRAENAADNLERTVVLHGDGLDIELLEEANISKTDAVLALTDDDKTNLLTCARAKSLGVELTVALINDPTLSGLMEPLNIDAYINPRATTVSSILRHIRHGRIRAIYSVGDTEAEVIEAQVLGTSAITGKRLGDIDWPNSTLVGGVLKGGEVHRPNVDTLIEEGDILTVFTAASDVEQVETLFQVSLDFF